LHKKSFISVALFEKPLYIGAVSKKKWLQQCEKNVQIKLTPKNFLLIIFNVVYIEVNETRKKL
jgi:hypothetical protein